MDISNSLRGKLNIWNLILMLLFLFAIDFLDKSGIIISIACLLCVIFDGSWQVPKSIGVLVVFGISYIFSLMLYESLTIDIVMKFLFLPAMTYYLGYCYGKRAENIGDVYKYALIIVVGFFIHSLLNFTSYLRVNGINFNANYRWANEFWRNGTPISVILNSLYSAPMAFWCTSVLISKKEKWIKLVAGICLGIIFFSMMLYQNRTTILAALIVVVIAAIKSWKNGFSLSALFTSMIIIAGLVGIWTFDLFGVRSFFVSTSIYNRLSGVANADRFQIWLSFFEGNPLLYPLGGRKVTLFLNKPYVHNMWLDTWWRVGILPFTCLVYMTIHSAKTMLQLSRLCSSDSQLQVSILNGMMLGLFINFLVEPVLEANPFIFYIPLLITGAAQGILRNIKYVSASEPTSM